MTFVNELIPEAYKEKFTFPVSTRPDGSKPTLWKWTIDRERNVFLVVTNIWGGGYEGTPEDYDYVLSWQDELIPFAAVQKLGGNKVDGVVMSWQVHRLEVPSTLRDRKDDVLQLIREALDAQGWLYDRNRLASVDVQFDSLATY